MEKKKLHFFATPQDFWEWLEQHHEKEEVLWVGFYKKATGKPSITWPESVDQALCFGWIDGLRKSVDEESYKIRFTPRRANSHWSAVNIRKVEEMKKKGLMQPTGLKAYKNRSEKKSLRASYEQGKIKLNPEYIDKIRTNEKAWLFYQSLSPYFKRASDWYVMSAKRKETQLRRLQILIDSSEKQQKIPPL